MQIRLVGEAVVPVADEASQRRTSSHRAFEGLAHLLPRFDENRERRSGATSKRLASFPREVVAVEENPNRMPDLVHDGHVGRGAPRRPSDALLVEAAQRRVSFTPVMIMLTR